MRKLIMGLAASTLAFAASSLYLWRELSIERARHATGVTSPTTPAAAVLTPTAQPAVASIPAATPAPATRHDARSREQMRAEAIIDARKQIAAAAPAFLASLANSQQRAEMLADQKRMMRTYSPGLQRYLGFTDDEFDRFLDALAELDLSGRESASRCALDSNCRFPDWVQSTAEARRRNALSQFGTDVADKYDFYQRSAGERQVVAEFRGRLDDATRLTDAQSDKLVRALMEEHQQIREDLQKSPGNIGAINGVAYAEMDVGVAEDSGADRTEEIAGYNRRLRDRAAPVLNAAQLAAFVQMQEDAIQQSREMNYMRRRQEATATN